MLREERARAASSRGMARRAMGWILGLFTVLLVGCDHATKLAAHEVLGRTGPVAILPGVLDLRYSENRDTAFSLLGGDGGAARVALLLVASAAALALLGAAWWRRRGAWRLEHAAFALIAAGAVGNVLDRAARGFVVDFIHVAHWPVFNVADALIVAGAALMAWLALKARLGPSG
jgi:signal peptidase II